MESDVILPVQSSCKLCLFVTNNYSSLMFRHLGFLLTYMLTPLKNIESLCGIGGKNNSTSSKSVLNVAFPRTYIIVQPFICLRQHSIILSCWITSSTLTLE